MEQLLWTFDQIVPFIDHPDRPVRQWALDRLINRFPAQAGEPLLAMLDDPSSWIAGDAIRFLAQTGDGPRYGPTLLDHLKDAQGSRFGTLAKALAQLDHRAALPQILQGQSQDTVRTDSREFSDLVHALGLFGGDEARQALWELLDGFDANTREAGFTLESLLGAAQPHDVTRAVQTYRAWPAGDLYVREMQAFAAPASAERLAAELANVVEDGLYVALDRAVWWLGREPVLSETCEAELDAVFARDHRGVFPALLREAQRMVEGHGHDLAAWRAAWDAGQRPAGYRGQVLYILLLFEAFAAHPSRHFAQRRRESALGLALLCELSVGHDDQATLDAADAKAAALLSILAQDRQNVLPDVVDRVAALGPEIVPPLVAMLDPGDYSWGMIRAIRAIERLARHHPGSCDAAIPGLIAVIHGEQGDFAKEAAMDALVAIGPSAADPIIEHLRDDDMSRQIYLTGALEQIPTESAAQAILDWLAAGEPLEEGHITALSGIGSPSAIEPLYADWKSDPDHLLAEHLLVLCQVNGIDRPELPEWRRVTEEEDDRLAAMLADLGPLSPEVAPSADPPLPAPAGRPQRTEPKQRSVRKPRTVSKKEKKKRSAQRRSSRKRKKKRKR